jgi:hypothetical protein
MAALNRVGFRRRETEASIILTALRLCESLATLERSRRTLDALLAHAVGRANQPALDDRSAQLERGMQDLQRRCQRPAVGRLDEHMYDFTAFQVHYQDSHFLADETRGARELRVLWRGRQRARGSGVEDQMVSEDRGTQRGERYTVYLFADSRLAVRVDHRIEHLAACQVDRDAVLRHYVCRCAAIASTWRAITARRRGEAALSTARAARSRLSRTSGLRCA